MSLPRHPSQPILEFPLPVQAPSTPWPQLQQQVHHQLIVSCQAPANSPLHDPSIIAAIAQATLQQGAAGLRIDSPEHIRAVRDRCPGTPLIGLWKQTFPNSDVYITPQLAHAQAVASAGADLIALDCTLRPRPDGTAMADLVRAVRQSLGKPVMADVDSLEAALAAVAAGADCVGTTLYGYTAATQHLSPPGFELLQQLVEALTVPVLCEGGIASPAMAQQAIALGAHAVVVGTAITGIDLLTQSYVQAMSRP